MIIRKTLNPAAKITPEELNMLKKAEKMPVIFDEESPELTEEDFKQFRCVSDERNYGRKKQTV